MNSFKQDEYIASPLIGISLFITSSIISVIGIFLINTDPINPEYIRNLSIGWMTVLIFGSFSCLGLVFVFLRRPKIILNDDGIHHHSLFKRRFWKWADIGPIRIDVVQARYGPMYCVCAFTNAHHDLMVANDRLQEATYINSDIIFELTGFRPGKNEKTADKFAQTLNAWREQFGRSEIKVDAEASKKAALDLAKTIKRRNIKHSTFIIYLVFTFFTFFIILLITFILWLYWWIHK